MKTWIYNEDDNSINQQKGDGTIDTVAIPQSGRLSIQERTSNGYLLAASPAMLSALESTLHWAESYNLSDPDAREHALKTLVAHIEWVVEKAKGKNEQTIQ